MTAVQLPGVTLNVKVDGAPDKPWIILSNSLGANLAMWYDQIDLLTSKYQVLRYDTRGHGESAVPEGPYSLDDLQDDVLALMAHFGIDRADWLGLSMGAMTGMGLAINHGERFGRMVFADGRADAPEGFRTMWDERCAKIASGGTAAIADGTMGTWLTAEFQAANPQVADKLRSMIVETPDDGYTACAMGLKNLDYLRRLNEIRLPALYVGGEADPGAPPEVMQEMADATPGASYIAIPDAAHIANVNAAARFNEIIATFFEI